MLKCTEKSSVELDGSANPITTLFASISAALSENVPVLIPVPEAFVYEAFALTTPFDKSP